MWITLLGEMRIKGSKKISCMYGSHISGNVAHIDLADKVTSWNFSSSSNASSKFFSQEVRQPSLPFQSVLKSRKVRQNGTSHLIVDSVLQFPFILSTLAVSVSLPRSLLSKLMVKSRFVTISNSIRVVYRFGKGLKAVKEIVSSKMEISIKQSILRLYVRATDDVRTYCKPSWFSH